MLRGKNTGNVCYWQRRQRSAQDVARTPNVAMMLNRHCALTAWADYGLTKCGR